MGTTSGTIRPLSDAECAELFGAAQPGRAEYGPLAGRERLHDYVTGGSARRDRVLGLFRGLMPATACHARPTPRAAAGPDPYRAA